MLATGESICLDLLNNSLSMSLSLHVGLLQYIFRCFTKKINFYCCAIVINYSTCQFKILNVQFSVAAYVAAMTILNEFFDFQIL